MTTVAARVSLNMLRSRQTRREDPLHAHVPDPVVDPGEGTDPEHEAVLADSVGLARAGRAGRNLILTGPDRGRLTSTFDLDIAFLRRAPAP